MRNGSGSYTLPSGNPVTTGASISSTWANSTLSDIASALTQSVSKDGQTTMTGNLPMGNNKVTGLADGTLATDAVSLGQLADDSMAGNIGYLPSGTGAVATTVQDKLRESVSVKDFGAVGDGVADDTAELQAAVTHAIAQDKALYIPAGTYLYSVLTGLAVSNITIFGDGSNNTVLKYTGTGDALVLGTTANFTQGVNISGLTVEGNSNVDRIIVAKAIARSQWTDINVREAKAASGIGFVFQGCQLSRFDSLMCSMDRQTMISPPYEAVNIESLAPFGNSSNNTFTNLYAEGAGNVATTIEIGVRISGGDQNTFIGGSPESCGTYGLLVAAGSRYNTFIGVGFENLNATADVGDSGISSKYINCYSSQSFIIQGRQCSVDGGYFERIQIDVGADKSSVTNVTLNNWATGSGGWFDSGTATEWKNLYDADLAAFIYPLKDRTAITVTASPFSWTNTTGQYVEVILQTGTVTVLQQYRGADLWLKPIVTPSCHLLPPGDSLVVSYSVAPSMSYVPHNGFQG